MRGIPSQGEAIRRVLGGTGQRRRSEVRCLGCDQYRSGLGLLGEAKHRPYTFLDGPFLGDFVEGLVLLSDVVLVLVVYVHVCALHIGKSYIWLDLGWRLHSSYMRELTFELALQLLAHVVGYL